MLLGAIAVTLLIAILWTLSWLLAMPLWIAGLGTVLSAGGWVGFFLWRRRKARAAAGEIEQSLRSQSESQAEAVRPDQQAEIDAMQAEFQKAVAALKSSKLARGGRDALAILPWYMIIGPPGAGKSTALRASGLQFPYLSGRGGGVRGVGGTRNCDWWLTNEAVLLDTAGRYAIEEEDREEWAGFLGMLARTRPKKPINGLIVAVSVGDLGGESEEAIVELAKRIRERMDEVTARLQMVLPAYVLFTKCDLVPGFVESFSDLRKQDRGQIWGFTAPLEASRAAPGELFKEKLDELNEVLEARALGRIAEERNVEVRERIWQFPQQIAALQPNLVTFVEALFAENVFQDTPVMRGAYFTSGTQEGRTIDRVMGSMAQAFGIRAPHGEAQPVLEAKSYFLRDVFKNVIFPDRDLAVRSAKAVRRQQLSRYGLAAGAAVAALLLFAFPLRAFLLNRSLVRSTGEIVASVSAALAAPQGTPKLTTIDPLRERLELLLAFEDEGAPWSMRFGMYQGRSLLPGVRSLYAAAVRRLLVEPVYALEVEEMDRFARESEASASMPAEADYASFYDRLKLHILLSGPRAAGEPRPSVPDQAWLAERVTGRWTGASGARDPGAARRVAANGALFARILAEEPALALTRYDDLVRRVRLVLGRVSFTSLAMEKLIREQEGKGYDLTLPIVLGETIPVLRNDGSVRGAFTRRGWEEAVKERLDDPASLLEPWVLARDGKDQEERLAEAASQLRSRYFELYIDEWRRFLDSTQVDVAAGGGALPVLQELTRGEPPPFPRLFRAVAYNVRVGGVAGALGKAGGGVLDRLRKNVGGQAMAAALQGDPTAPRELGPADVEKAFASFVAFGLPAEAAPGAPPAPGGGGAAPAARSVPLDLYMEQLSFVRDALRDTLDGADPGPLKERVQAARTRIRALIDGAQIGWRPRLEALLWPPLDAASRDSAREAASGASLEWCSAVAQPFRRSMAGRYPFSRDGDDAAVADVAEFFRPGGVVWGFYEAGLKSEIQRAADGFKFARQLGGVSGFRPELLSFLKRAQDVTTVLFPAGASDPKVEFSVRIRPTPGVAVVWLEVDGQKFDYRNGPEEWHRFAWPGQGKVLGAALRVKAANGQEEIVQQEGEWGLFRLLEAGRLKGDPGARDFAVSWALPAIGSSVTIDFRPARSDAPFFGPRRAGVPPRLMAPFRSGVLPPANIGRGTSSCG
jgi:type VI secretion system protein ImpL